MNAHFTFRKTMYDGGEALYSDFAVTTFRTEEAAIAAARKALRWVSKQYNNPTILDTPTGAKMYAETDTRRILLYYELA